MTSDPTPYGLELEGLGTFAGRPEAGQRLAERLGHLRSEAPLVLALPRGGVPIGYQIARALAAPLDLILVRKIGLPSQPELAYAAIAEGDPPEIAFNEDIENLVQLPEGYLDQARQRELAEIERRRRLYLAGRVRQPIKDRTAIIVDDGIATGATMRVALRVVRRAEPRRSVLAVPVAPSDTIESLRREVDEVVCLMMPQHFGAIGLYFRDFHQLTDGELIDYLDRAASITGEGTDSSGN